MSEKRSGSIHERKESVLSYDINSYDHLFIHEPGQDALVNKVHWLVSVRNLRMGLFIVLYSVLRSKWSSEWVSRCFLFHSDWYNSVRSISCICNVIFSYCLGADKERDWERGRKKDKEIEIEKEVGRRIEGESERGIEKEVGRRIEGESERGIEKEVGRRIEGENERKEYSEG
jgi:hypothetical protein